jgi:hypothetical protein
MKRSVRSFLFALMLVVACAATPTSLTVRVVFPDGEPLTASFLDVTITGAADAGRKLVYERSTLAPGDLDQTFVVILDRPAVGQTLDVLVEAREAAPVDGGADAGASPGRIAASGNGAIAIVADRDNVLTVPLTLR